MVRLKALLHKALCHASKRFQFLMVRLKASVKGFCFLAVAVFQFLMVRLKVVCNNSLTLVKFHFNSLWCD